MEQIQCIFCNKSSDQVVVRENGYKGRKCSQCRLIFISPRPTSSEIQALYNRDRAHISAESHITAAFPKRLHARHKIAIIKRHASTGTLLEIGPGAGYFLDEVRKAGFDVYGIEPNKIQANFIVRNFGIPIEQTPLDDSSFSGLKFDIVHHEDIISHFYDPIAEFRKINERLTDSGLLVFETGNFGDVKQKYYGTIKAFQYPDHLFLFSEENLRMLLEMTGFECLRIYRYSILPQLVVGRIAGKVARLLGKGDAQAVRALDNGEPVQVPQAHIQTYGVKRLAENTYRYLSYFLRYKIGYMMPKKGRPQTVIVVAKRRK